MNYFLIHGSFGSPFANWLPWLRKQLRNQSEEVYTPDFPTGVGFQNCFYTKNDPYVSYEAEKEFADTIATKQIIIENGGHLNSESGYREFPELLEVL